jgi:GNAT superfamily N-acetyltransferase
MDEISLSLKMKRMHAWLDRRCQPAGLIQKTFDASPFGHCYVTIDPERQGPFASGNHNRVLVCGTEEGLQPDSLDRLIVLFVAKGVRRFFIWLSPGPDMETVRGWLEQRGFSRIRRTGYPTLWRRNRVAVAFATDLVVREVGPHEVAAARDQLGDAMWPEYAACAGIEGIFHYMAFDHDRPVAVAALCVFEDIGYLMMAATTESHRQRGAQQALIAARIERADLIGCPVLVSETLYMLQHSYRNLQRAGFQEAYEKEVFEWNA